LDGSLAGHLTVIDVVAGVVVAEVDKAPGEIVRFSVAAGDYRVARDAYPGGLAARNLTMPAHLAEVIGRMKAEHVRLIAVQPYQNRKTAETVARHTGATVLDWPSFPGGKGTESYLDWIDYLVRSIAHGFAAAK
ncbi:MAG: zinc ABC transporter substrate-binding protein, partial [Opitutae bacterium]|nr:zinc ABC transporter substrate-binding protein [Opitutae bacterium]